MQKSPPTTPPRIRLLLEKRPDVDEPEGWVVGVVWVAVCFAVLIELKNGDITRPDSVCGADVFC